MCARAGHSGCCAGPCRLQRPGQPWWRNRRQLWWRMVRDCTPAGSFPSSLVPGWDLPPSWALGAVAGPCSAPSLPAGEVGTETRSLLEQLRGEALKFHKPGECEEPLPHARSLHRLFAPASALHAVGDQPGAMSVPAGCWAWLGLSDAVALSILCLQERTTRRRAMW